MNRLVVLGALVWLGCGGNDGPPGGQPDAGEATPDVNADADATCRQWRRVAVPVLDVASMESTVIHPERTARMLVDVEQCPGDVTGAPEIGFTLENEYVALSMYVWRSGPDCYIPETVQRPVSIRFLYPGSWKFTLSGGGQRTVTVAAAPGGTCNPGGACQRDCDCTEQGAACLSGYGIAAQPIQQCAVPCEFDRDCYGNGRCVQVADGLSSVCNNAPECDGATPCPDGFACNANRCEPTFTLRAATRHECTCDSECDDGMRCAFHEGAATGRCEALCQTASDGWCEGAHTCGRGSVEPALGVCGWVGE